MSYVIHTTLLGTHGFVHKDKANVPVPYLELAKRFETVDEARDYLAANKLHDRGYVILYIVEEKT